MNNLIFCDIKVSKKEFHKGKKEVYLSEVSVDKIVVSNKIKEKNETSKFFIGYMDDISSFVTPLCVILPQMSGWIKYFENGSKNVSFEIEDDSVYLKYNWFIVNQLMIIVTLKLK